MTSQQSLEDRKIQAAYEALEEAAKIVARAMPETVVDYEPVPGFIYVRLSLGEGLSYGLVDENAAGDIGELDDDGNPTGVILQTVGTSTPSTNADPWRYALDVLEMVWKRDQPWP